MNGAIDWYKIAESKAQIILYRERLAGHFAVQGIAARPVSPQADIRHSSGPETWCFLALSALALIGAVGCAAAALWSRHVKNVQGTFALLGATPTTRTPTVPRCFGTFGDLAHLRMSEAAAQGGSGLTKNSSSSHSRTTWSTSRVVLRKHRYVNAGWMLTAMAIVALVCGAMSLFAHTRLRADAPSTAHAGRYASGAKNREARPRCCTTWRRRAGCASVPTIGCDPRPSSPATRSTPRRSSPGCVNTAASTGGDPSQLFVAGSSAGSNTAALCALTPNDPSFQPGVRVGDTSVTAAICLYGYYGHFFGNHRTSPPPAQQPRGIRTRRCATVPRRPWHQGHARHRRAHGASSRSCGAPEQCRRLRRTARWAAFIRRLSLCAFRGGRGRGGSLRRLGSRLPSALPILLPSLLGSAAQELGFGSGVTCNHAA